MTSLAPAPWTVSPSNLSNGTDLEPFLPEGLYFHPHWQLYQEMLESMPDLSFYILGIYIAFVCTVGILGNLLVIYIFTTTRSLRSPSNMFIINLAISDLGFSAVNGFPLMTISCFTRAWYFGGLACQIYALLGGLFGYNSIASLACISYDRYFVISNPLVAMRKSTKKRAFLQILICWAWSILWSIPPLFGWGAYIPEGFQTWCSFDYLTRTWANISFVMCIFIFGFCFPVLLIAYCYVNIITAVVAQKKEMQKTAEKMGAKTTSEDAKSKAQEITLAKVAAGTITLFCLSWMPYAAISLMGIWGMTPWVNPYTATTPVMAAKASAMWNPIIYALSHPRFRAVLDEKFPWLVCCRGRNMDKGGPSKGMTTSQTNASNMSVEMKGRRDEDSSSICTEISESGVTDAGGNQGTLVDTNPDPTKGVEAQPPAPAPPPAETPAPENGSAKHDPKSKITEMQTKRKFGSSRRTAGKVLGTKAADALRGAMQAYISLRGAAAAMKVEESDVEGGQGYENPVYTADETEGTAPCTTTDETAPAGGTAQEKPQPAQCASPEEPQPAQCTSPDEPKPAQCTSPADPIPPQCTDVPQPAPSPNKPQTVNENSLLSIPQSDQAEAIKKEITESIDSNIDNSMKRSPEMEFNPHSIANGGVPKSQEGDCDLPTSCPSDNALNGASPITPPDKQTEQIEPAKSDATIELESVKVVPNDTKESLIVEGEIKANTEDVSAPSSNVEAGVEGNTQESVSNINKQESLQYDDGFV